MPNYTYLIVGGGMTGDAALHGIREIDRAGSIGLIGSEAHPPYNRPPLSKALWKGNPLESIWRKGDEQARPSTSGELLENWTLRPNRPLMTKGPSIPSINCF